MAAGYPEKMRDATGRVHTYTEPPQTGRTGPTAKVPKHPHPDAILQVHDSGRGINPCTHLSPLADVLAYYEERGEEPNIPVSGDETARLAAWQCWDDLTGRLRQKTYTGTEPCEEPSCPHPQPHTASSWFYRPVSDPWNGTGTAYYRDIAHVLYPGGVVPVPVRDEPAPAAPARPEPQQLTIFDALEVLT